MRYVALLTIATCVAAAMSTPSHAGYYCSPGFAASYGQCVAVASRYEVALYRNEPIEPAPAPIRRHHRHHHVLKARY